MEYGIRRRRERGRCSHQWVFFSVSLPSFRRASFLLSSVLLGARPAWAIINPFAQRLLPSSSSSPPREMFRLQCSTNPVEEAGDRCFPLISKAWCEWKGFVWHYLLFVQWATSEHRLGAHPPRHGLCPFQPRSTGALARSWLLGDLLLRSGGPASFCLVLPLGSPDPVFSPSQNDPFGLRCLASERPLPSPGDSRPQRLPSHPSRQSPQ